jgi:hypothetical protein
MAISSSRTAPPPSPAPAAGTAWTRLTGDFEFMELCEFSFSEELNAHTDTHATTHDELHAEVAGAFDTTAMATETTLLNPRFYTTDFDEMDRIDVTPVRKEWDALIAQMKSDPNKGHFKKNADWDQIDWDGMDRACGANSSTSSCRPAPPSFRAACFTRK